MEEGKLKPGCCRRSWQNVLRMGGGGRGSSVFPFAAFSAHSPSCLLRASLTAVTATPQY